MVVVVVVVAVVVLTLVCANIQFLSLPVPRHETLHATEYRTEVYHNISWQDIQRWHQKASNSDVLEEN